MGDLEFTDGQSVNTYVENKVTLTTQTDHCFTLDTDGAVVETACDLDVPFICKYRKDKC